MPFDFSSEIDPAKLTTLMGLTSPKIGELVRVDWGGGDDIRFYASKDYNNTPGFTGLAAYGISNIEVKFEKKQFLEIPHTSDVSDDSVSLNFLDFDQSVSTLYRTVSGEGTKVIVYRWLPDIDLLTEVFWAILEAPDSMDGYFFKVKASAGFRSPQIKIPHRTQYAGCQAIFGGQQRSDGSYLFQTLAAVAENDCKHNRHLGGSIGTAGFTSCPRNHVDRCQERFASTPRKELPYLAFDFTSGQALVGAGDHKWTGETRGNEAAQNKVLRVVAGGKYIHDLTLQAFQPQSGGSHPEDGYCPTLWSICEGPIDNAYLFDVNGQQIASNHTIFNDNTKGQIGQHAISFPTPTLNYSGTAIVRLDAGPHNWIGVQATDFSANCFVRGKNDVRVYTGPTTFTKQYTTNRAWWILECLTNRRWGYGIDYGRIEIQDFIDLADWCDDIVTVTDSEGVVYSFPRSTFNADLNENTVAEQFNQICSGGRISLPFNYHGKLRILPLGNFMNAPDIPGVPTFTDQGETGRNIMFSGGKSSLTWSRESDKKVINQVKGSFDDGAFMTQPQHKVIIDDLDQQLKAGVAFGDFSLRLVSDDFTAFGVTNLGEALRLFMLHLRLGKFDGFEKPGTKNNLRVKFSTWSPYADGVKLHPWRVIRVLNSFLQLEEEQTGMPYQFFRVMKMTNRKDLKLDIEAQAFPTNYIGHSEDETIPHALPTPNPGGDRTSRLSPVRPRLEARTVDTITISTEVY